MERNLRCSRCLTYQHAPLQILLGSAAVSFGLAFYDEGARHEGLRAFVEPLVIVLILILNAAVGVWQESRSEAALEALKELQSEHARVLRDGKMVRCQIQILTQRICWPASCTHRRTQRVARCCVDLGLAGKRPCTRRHCGASRGRQSACRYARAVPANGDSPGGTVFIDR